MTIRDISLQVVDTSRVNTDIVNNVSDSYKRRGLRGAYSVSYRLNMIDASIPQPTATVDWSEMRSLYVKGLSLAELARRTGISLGTIKARSAREKWATTVARAEQHVDRMATEQMAASATRWLGRIDNLMHASIDNIERKGVGKLSLRDLATVVDVAEKANRVARLTYGLDADNASKARVTVNVAVLDRHNTTDTQVIDVDTLPVATSDAPHID